MNAQQLSIKLSKKQCILVLGSRLFPYNDKKISISNETEISFINYF